MPQTNKLATITLIITAPFLFAAICWAFFVTHLEAKGQTKPRTVQIECPFSDCAERIKAALPKDWQVVEATAEDMSKGRDLPVDFILLWDQRKEDGRGVLVAFILKRDAERRAIISELFRSEVMEMEEVVKAMATKIEKQ
jgi:hypothetical protein